MTDRPGVRFAKHKIILNEKYDRKIILQKIAFILEEHNCLILTS